MIRKLQSIFGQYTNLSQANRSELARLEEDRKALSYKHPSALKKLLQWMGVGAMLLGFLYAAVWFEQPIEVWLKNASRPEAVHILADGSLAALGPNSSLAMPERFKDNRTLRVIGVSRFDVKADTLEFLVRTPRAQISTTAAAHYVVRANPNEPTVVSVRSGSVTVVDLTTAITPPPMVVVQAGGTHTVSGPAPVVPSPYRLGNVLRFGRKALWDMLPW